ncbi:MAG: LytR/AlgR family response regulator transcription factor [Bacteroidia bacterium]
MTVKCIVLDDDPVFCAITAKFVEDHPQLQLLKKFTDSAEAKQFMYKNYVQLLLADMEMPGGTGIDFVRSLPSPPEIIFITAHRDYAVESYELQAIDYLVKPINHARFNNAICRALTQMEINLHADSEKNSLPIHIRDDHFFIRSDSQFVRIKFADIYYIEALKDFVKIHTTARSYIALVNLKHIEAALPFGLFLRTHRSYLVNRSHIIAIDTETVQTATASLPLGNTYKDFVLERMLGNSLIKRH